MPGVDFKVWMVLGGCVAFAAVNSPAQPPPESGPPRMLLATGGPVSPVRALAFAPTSDRLFSAGADKLVRVWDLQRVGPQRQLRATLAHRLHWEIARGTRGYVYALAVSPDGQRVALAGISARDANGNIAVYDTGLADLEQVLGGPGGGHRQTLVALDFSPNGQRLASVSIDGEARLWTVGDWQSVVLRKASANLIDPQPALFLSDSVLALATPDPDRPQSDWRIALHQVTDPGRRPTLLSRPHASRVMSLARAPDSEAWASSDAAGNVYLWKGPRPASPELLCRGRVAGCLAFVPGGRLLFATRQDANKQSVLELWDIRRKAQIDQIVLATGEDSYACAASRDGSYAVAYAPPRGELMLFTLNDGDGRPLAKPLSTQAVTRLRGSGQPIWKVAFDARGTYRLGLGTQPREEARQAFGDDGTIDKVFDPLQGRLSAAGAPNDAWRLHTDGSDGWSITPAEGNLALVLSQRGQQRGRIDLHPVYQGRARSFCWLVDAEGRTYGVAVGTDRQHGVFAYELPQAGQCRLLRYFRDHRGWVTSLGVSSDGKYLASASVDQTAKIWSLDGILTRNPGFKLEGAWGALFQARPAEDVLVVASLSKAGIAARRGLELGDTIVAVRHVKNGQVQVATDPGEMLQALEANPIWQTVVLSVRKAAEGRAERVLLVPAWEPLITLYVARNGEWASWTPQGYYHASVEGDEMFGWQINRGWDVRPLFYQADRFRQQLERPEVIRQLLSSGNLPDALQATLGSVPRDVQDRVSTVSATLPNLRIIQPRDNARIAEGEPIDLVATADFPNRQAAEEYKFRCYVNQVPMGEPAHDVAGQTGTYRWRMPPVDEYNRVEVLAVHEEELADSPYSDAAVHVRADLAERDPPRLHVIAFAAEDYNGEKIQLDYAVDDAESFVKAIEQAAGRYYQLGTVVLLTDRQISRKSVDAAITDLRQQLGDVDPHDVLITFHAGHGIAENDEYYFLPPDPSLTLENTGGIEQLGIPWQMLRRLAAIPCRKLFLLDTCHSGNALLLDTDPLYHQKHAVRPIKRTQSVVVSATDVGQPSYEEESLEHGLFTYNLLKALDGSADGYFKEGTSSPGPDGTIELAESIYYVVDEVPKMARQLGGEQQPKVSPADLWYFPLVRYRK